MPTVAEVIEIADLSSMFAQQANSRGRLFNPIVDPKLSIKIYMENAALSWMNDIDPSNTSQSLVAQYVLSMCGAYRLKSQAIISGGGGSVNPGSPNLLPTPYQFIVSASSYIITGQSTKTITSFVGYNLYFVRSHIPQSTVNDGGTYYSWDSGTGVFTCYDAANEGELFQLFAV